MVTIDNLQKRKKMGVINGRSGPLEEEMAIHFSILAWEIPWIVERGGLQSMGVSKELDTT